MGPELAEDHSTSLLMNAGGWRGVHAIDAIAHGAGPATFADLAIQEFQWSRSLMTIFLQHTPRYLARLPVRLRMQFVFCELWYPLFAGFMLLKFLVPINVAKSMLAYSSFEADVSYQAPARTCSPKSKS